jgi:hypothetical protein
MTLAEEYIQTYVQEIMRPSARELSSDLGKLLSILKAKGLLRKKLSGRIVEKREIIVEAERNADKILAASNKFYDLLLNKDKRAEFLEFTHKNDFTDLDLKHLLHSQLIFGFLLNMETFKNFLLLVLDGSSSHDTLGSLFGKDGTLIKQTKETGEAKRVSERLDICLRNSLSHFAFKQDGQMICYYAYSKKGDITNLGEGKISSSELLAKIHEVSLMRALLGCLIADMYGQ